MTCTHPIYAVDLGIHPETGKRKVKIIPKRPDTYNLSYLENKYGSSSILSLPCGHCLACKVNYARDWSVRCMLEASQYDSNWFLTLTYDDVHLPSDKKVNKKDVQKFIKDLRHYIPGLRFLACAEYGEHTGRPHYHLILFNCEIKDVKCISKGRYGGHYFDSELLRKVWSKGQITLGFVTPASCEYVARYTLKKINGDEFILMSLKPGIGGQYFVDHLDAIYDTDGVYVHGKKYKVPRYSDKVLEKVNPDLFSRIKKDRVYLQRLKRLSKLSETKLDFEEQLYDLDEKVNIGNLKNKLLKGAL